MDWADVAGYGVMLGFFWLCWKGWCDDTRKMKRQVRWHDD